MKYFLLLALSVWTNNTFAAPLQNAESSDSAEKEGVLTFNENFHVFMVYNNGSLTLNLGTPNTLPEAPQSGLYTDNTPASGSFSGGSVREFRSIVALLFTRKKQLFHVGLGLSNTEIGKPGPKLTKGLASTSLHINSLSTEISVIRKIPKFGYTKGTLSLDTMIDGQITTTYDTNSDGSVAIINSQLKSGYKLTISGEYHINITNGLSIGMNAGIQYGVMKFDNRKGQSSLFGLSYGLAMLLRI